MERSKEQKILQYRARNRSTLSSSTISETLSEPTATTEMTVCTAMLNRNQTSSSHELDNTLVDVDTSDTEPIRKAGLKKKGKKAVVEEINSSESLTGHENENQHDIDKDTEVQAKKLKNKSNAALHDTISMCKNEETKRQIPSKSKGATENMDGNEGTKRQIPSRSKGTTENMDGNEETKRQIPSRSKAVTGIMDGNKGTKRQIPSKSKRATENKGIMDGKEGTKRQLRSRSKPSLNSDTRRVCRHKEVPSRSQVARDPTECQDYLDAWIVQRSISPSSHVKTHHLGKDNTSKNTASKNGKSLDVLSGEDGYPEEQECIEDGDGEQSDNDTITSEVFKPNKKASRRRLPAEPIELERSSQNNLEKSRLRPQKECLNLLKEKFGPQYNSPALVLDDINMAHNHPNMFGPQYNSPALVLDDINVAHNHPNIIKKGKNKDYMRKVHDSLQKRDENHGRVNTEDELEEDILSEDYEEEGDSFKCKSSIKEKESYKCPISVDEDADDDILSQDFTAESNVQAKTKSKPNQSANGRTKCTTKCCDDRDESGKWKQKEQTGKKPQSKRGGDYRKKQEEDHDHGDGYVAKRKTVRKKTASKKCAISTKCVVVKQHKEAADEEPPPWTQEEMKELRRYL